MDKKLAIGLVAVGLVSIVLLGGAPQVTREEFDTFRQKVQSLQLEVHTRSVVIEDENGKHRATLGMTEFGPSLSLLDETGKLRARLAVSSDGALLRFYDEKDRLRCSLVQFADVVGLILKDEGDLFHEKDKSSVSVMVSRGVSAIALNDADGHVIWHAP